MTDDRRSLLIVEDDPGLQKQLKWSLDDYEVVFASTRPDAIAALRLVDYGVMSASSIGAGHGELGHTQFLPGNALKYGVDGNGDGAVDLANSADALASTANFLHKKGWKPGRGYQKGEANFAVLKEWNAAGVYQQAIAIMAAQIDG